jgi:sarcosine oxidase gamma subunit
VRDLLEAAASAAPFASVVEMTAAYGSNALVGPLSRETFARTMALDQRPDHFAEGDFAPVSVARTPGMVLREGGDRFLHLFGAGFAHYVWTVFVDAARHLGGRAVGVTALGATTSTEEVAHA